MEESGGQTRANFRFGTLLDSLCSNPAENQVCAIADLIRMKVFSSVSSQKVSLSETIFEIMCKATESDPTLHIFFGQLLEKLRTMSLSVKDGQSWQTAISETIKLAAADLMAQSEPSPDIFRQHLKFVNEIVRLKLVASNVFLSYADLFFKSFDASYYVPYIFELLRNIDDLASQNLVNLPIHEEQLWNCYCCYLAGIINRAIAMDPECPILGEIFNYLQWRGNRYKHTHGPDCENQPALFSNDSEKNNEKKEQSKIAEKSAESPVRPLTPIKCWKVGRLLATLETNPDRFGSVQGELRTRLTHCRVSKEFIDLVSSILNEMCKVKQLPLIWRKLILAFRSISIRPTGKYGDVSFVNAVHAWSQRNFVKYFTSIEDVKALSGAFFLVNELFKMKIIPFKVLNHYARKVRNANSEALMYFLYKLLKLARVGGWVADEEAARSWQERHRFLRNALQHGRKFSGKFNAKIPKILQFLDSVHQNGGWIARPFSTPLPANQPGSCSPNAEYVEKNEFLAQSSVAECDSTSAIDHASTSHQIPTQEPDHLHDKVPQRPTSLPIFESLNESYSSASASNSEMTAKIEQQIFSVNSQDSVCHQESSTLSEQPSQFAHPSDTNVPENLSVGCSFSSSASLEAAVADLKQRLVSQPPWRFVGNVFAILDMILPQIDLAISLDSAAQLCIELGPITNSRGENFAFEMEQYCLKLFRNFEQELVNTKPKTWTNDQDLKSILDYMSAQTELNFQKKYVKCEKLIGRLYSLDCVSFSFLLSFLETLLRTKNEDLYLGMLEMLEIMSAYGMDLEWQAVYSRAWREVDLFYEDLARFGEHPQTPFTMKVVVQEIFASKQNGFRLLTPQQTAVRKLKILLSALTSNQLSERQRGFVQGHLRAFLNDCPNEWCQHIFASLVSTVEDLTHPAEVPTPPNLEDFLKMLKKYPNASGYLSDKIRRELVGSKSKEEFQSSVFTILESMSYCEPLSEDSVKLLEALCHTSLENSGDQEDCSFEKCVENWIHRTFMGFRENSDLLEKIWFHNQICQLGLFSFETLPRELMKFYERNSTNAGALTFLLRLLESYDQLIDTGVWHFEDREAKLWGECGRFLLEKAQNTHDITRFLHSVREKGGWLRNFQSQVTLSEDGDVIVIEEENNPPEHFAKEKIGISMKSFFQNPEKTNQLALEMKDILCGLPNRTSFACSAFEIMNTLLEKSKPTKHLSESAIRLLKILCKAQISDQKVGSVFTFQFAVNDWALRNFQSYQTVEAAETTADKFWFHNEICKLNVLSFKMYKIYVGKAMTKLFPAAMVFVYRVLKEVASLIESNVWKQFSEEEAAFFSGASFALYLDCRIPDFAKYERTSEIYEFLTTISETKIWYRKFGDVPLTPSPPRNRAVSPLFNGGTPQNGASQENNQHSVEPGSFSLLGDHDHVVENLKIRFEFQPEAVFDERLALFLLELFEQITDDFTLHAAAKLCLALSDVTSKCGRIFMAEVKTKCFQYFAEPGKLPPNSVLMVCPKLISSLFAASERDVPVHFVLSFLDALVSTKNESVFQGVMAMLKSVGRAIETRAAVKGLSHMLDGCFNQLDEMRRKPDCSENVKSLIEDFISLKQNGWVVLTPEQRAIQKIESLLPVLTLESTGDLEAFCLAAGKIRLLINDICPTENSQLICKIFLSKMESLVLTNRDPIIKIEASEEMSNVTPREKLNPSDPRKRRLELLTKDHSPPASKQATSN